MKSHFTLSPYSYIRSLKTNILAMSYRGITPCLPDVYLAIWKSIFIMYPFIIMVYYYSINISLT